MTDTPPDFPSNSVSKAYKCVQKVVNDGISFPTSSYAYENKRKPSLMDTGLDLQDGSSLSIGLGCSMSSSITMFSNKEIEEHSSRNLDLTMNLYNQTEVDLELSLAAGSVESNVTRSSNPFNGKPWVTSSTMTSAGFQLVDEGSTSSRWKLPLLAPLQTAEPVYPFLYDSNRPNLVVHSGSGSGFGSIGTGSVPPQPRCNTNMKNCQFIGCTRGARGASGFCISHGGGRRCQREGCQKGAEGKTVFCKAHGGGRRCEFLGCTKSAEGRTDHCIGHGGGRRCSHEGCTHAARGKSGLCIRHGGGKRCKMEGCTKSAEGASGLCISHGGGKRCQYLACTKGAQGSTMFCKAHGGGKRCTFFGCTKGAEGSTNLCKGHGGGKRCKFDGGCSKSVHGGTSFCVSHGGGKRCSMPECTKSARGRTSFCVRHGGGKRCKHDGCGKSAQGRTEFCKAHGGGKQRAWVRVEPDKQNPALEIAGPEGRVHGGSLMALLRGSTSDPSEPGGVRVIGGGGSVDGCK
ncbi:hypothetical protein E3N88_07363 [Mikania micrantha]|uniref:WRKY19-like zinc finger domain-containing protein n=1 Tax=Mikania micrantha TaxID=192012 RepID=A0A5N6PTG1_9ASTR|nr:hypothetical protein E3N88_07363 [Mikania micrantha]